MRTRGGSAHGELAADACTINVSALTSANYRIGYADRGMTVATWAENFDRLDTWDASLP